MKNAITKENLEQRIFVIREHKDMVGRDLADL